MFNSPKSVAALALVGAMLTGCTKKEDTSQAEPLPSRSTVAELNHPDSFPKFPVEADKDLNGDGFLSLDQETLVPIASNDRALLQIASGSTMRLTTLPSGAVVPDLPEGSTWKVVGPQLKIVDEANGR